MGAQRHNKNRRTAGSGRWMGMGGAARRFISICNSYAAKPGLTVTDQDKRERSVGKSRSVTPTDQNRTHLLQIETAPTTPSPFEETTATLIVLNNLMLRSLR